MELGRATLRGNGLNLLLNGIHPRHGLVWTDGKAIYLAPVRLYGNNIDNAKSLKLGEFDNVQSLHWSVDVDSDTSFLCAIHKQNVTVWKVTGLAPKLGFKQVRKLNVQPIPQGCLWHPRKDILCLLSQQQCSFYFRHTHNKSSYAFPQLESGRITCGTWSEDGQRLVLCVGTVVLVYIWPNIETSISDFTPAAWKVPGLDGSITSIVSLSHDSLVCRPMSATELPLESLCKQRDMFVVPDVVSSSEDRAINGSDDVIAPRGSQVSAKDSLLNLERNPQSLVQDTSQLVVIRLHDKLQDPSVISRTNVRGVLVPDVLTHEPRTNSVIVGGNNQSLLQIFTFLGEELHKVSDIQLEKHQRPKGSCRLPPIFAQTSSGVLVMVGQRDISDSAFPSSTNEARFTLLIRYFPIKLDKSHLRNSFSVMPSNLTSDTKQQEQKIKSLSGSNLPSRTPSKSRVTSPSVATHDTSNIKISVAPSSRSSRDGGDTNRLVLDLSSNGKAENLETETVQFSSQTPKFQNSDVDKFFDSVDNGRKVNGCRNVTMNAERDLPSDLSRVRRVEQDDVCVVEDSNSVPTQDQAGCDQLALLVNSQKDQIAALQKKIDMLSQAVENTSCIFPTKYQSPEQPEKVKVIYETSDGHTLTRSFLLDSGRLQLDPVKQAFGLATVELIMDGDPCVLGANIDGYIPMKFGAGSTLSITGVPACISPSSPRDTNGVLDKDPVSGASRC
ncbi:LOW QUALITY PROTEIN: WD repeat and coiled-coil-containing protein-like [Haliotis rubra]|uniref:LOW QUALITY PROTEIN: WD repeat and coiled-coil-containing protein-like n=1 Tax=Haliotis rubra TaxID=36100 RepID=UPI001EE5A71D|nr:LOW QUALITY PROTEIN: WD repeat and coiled-coil-containing protein-like [Haliotis rubra]